MCDAAARMHDAARGSAQQAQHEDRAPMRVHAAGRGKHASLSLYAQSLQHGEFCPFEACFGDLEKVVTQRRKAAHEGVCVHVVVAAAAFHKVENDLDWMEVSDPLRAANADETSV